DSRWVQPARAPLMQPVQLLHELASYCPRTGLAESTFGPRAVNDGKLVQRLRSGGRITIETLDRIRGFMAAGGSDAENASEAANHVLLPFAAQWPLPAAAPAALPDPGAEKAPQQNFRFFDNRQKYL